MYENYSHERYLTNSKIYKFRTHNNLNLNLKNYLNAFLLTVKSFKRLKIYRKSKDKKN